MGADRQQKSWIRLQAQGGRHTQSGQHAERLPAVGAMWSLAALW